MSAASLETTVDITKKTANPKRPNDCSTGNLAFCGLLRSMRAIGAPEELRVIRRT